MPRGKDTPERSTDRHDGEVGLSAAARPSREVGLSAAARPSREVGLSAAARPIAPGGVRRALYGFGLGAVLGFISAALAPRPGGPRRRS